MWWRPSGADYKRRGRGWRRRLCRRVASLSLRGRQPFGPRVMVAPFGRRFYKKEARPIVISTVAKRSGEISPSDGTGYGITLGNLRAQSIINAFSICPIPTCISARDDDVGEHPYRHFDRSGAEWRNLTPQWAKKGAAGAAGCVEGLHPTGKTTHYILCVAPLLQNVFAVHRFHSGAPEADKSPNEPMHPRPLPTGGIIGNILIMYKN